MKKYSQNNETNMIHKAEKSKFEHFQFRVFIHPWISIEVGLKHICDCDTILES